MRIDAWSSDENEWTFTRAELTALIECASKDSSRSNLTQIMLDAERGSAVTTDGHRLCAVRALKNNAENMEGRRIATSGLAPIIRAARANHQIVIRPTAETSYVRVVNPDELGVVTLVTSANVSESNELFPPWWQVVPDTPQKNTAPLVGINGHYLAHIAKIAKACETKIGTVGIYVGSELEPVVFKATSSDCLTEWTYVVMPMRL